MTDDERIPNATPEERERMKEPGGILSLIEYALLDPTPSGPQITVEELDDMLRDLWQRRIDG